jgi:hypothetical protein
MNRRSSRKTYTGRKIPALLLCLIGLHPAWQPQSIMLGILFDAPQHRGAIAQTLRSESDLGLSIVALNCQLLTYSHDSEPWTIRQTIHN